MYISLSFYLCELVLAIHFIINCMFISLMLYSILELALVRYNGACPKNAVKFKINSSQIIQKKTEDFYDSSPSVTTQEEYFLRYVTREFHSKGNVLMKKL